MATFELIYALGLGGLAGLLAGYGSRVLAGGSRHPLPLDRFSILLAAVGAAAVALHPMGRSDLLPALAESALVGVLLMVTASDIRERAVYPAIVYPGIVIAAAAAPMLGSSLGDAMVGSIIIGLIFAVMYGVARVVSGPGALGFGDVSVAAFVGAVAGASRIQPALALISLLGGLIALAVAVRTRSLRASFPDAPALCLGALGATLL